MIKFLIESSICLSLLYGVYWFFLRKEKLLGLNRYYLIGAVFFSLVIPLLEFNFTPSWVAPVQTVTNIFPSSGMANTGVLEPATKTDVFNLSTVYLVGVGLSAIMLLLRFYLTLKKSGLKLSFRRKGVQVLSADGYQAFSFLNTITLGREIVRNPELKKTIMLHEMAHVQGRHSIDLLIMEVFKCLYWFNPIIYLAIKSLKIQHEYIADAHVLEQVSPTVYERSLATLTLAKIDHRLVHAFGKLPLENRIKMIYNTNSNVMNKLKLLLVLPLVGILVFQFSCSENAFAPEEIETLDEGMTVLLEKTVHAMNIKSDGEAVRDDKTFRLHGIVKDAEGLVLGGVKVSTSESGNETISKDDGTFSLRVANGDKELKLNHPEKKLSIIDLENSFPPTIIEVVEIPDHLHLDASTIREKIREFDGVIIERPQEEEEVNTTIKYEVTEERIFEEKEIEMEPSQKKELDKLRTIIEKKKNEY